MRIKNRNSRNFINAIGALFGRPNIAFPVIPDDGRILFFRRDRRDFGFLSNFFRCKIQVDGREWPHNEAYYQSQKSENPDYLHEICKREHPAWAKFVGDSRIGHPKIARKSWFRKHPDDLRADWDMIKVEVMRKALHAKFFQNERLKLALLNTDQAELVEDSRSDFIWGCGEDGSGGNMLGILLMEVRSQIQEDVL